MVLGAGSTFVYPVLAKWAEVYEAATGVRIDYQAVGSGVGIRQIKSRTVDFGASDAPLRPDELAAAGLMSESRTPASGTEANVRAMTTFSPPSRSSLGNPKMS